MTSDQLRLWRERPRDKKPSFYEYPTSGYDIVALKQVSEVELIQINDYENKRKIYYVTICGSNRCLTTDRTEADVAFTEAIAEYEEAIQANVNHR